MGNPCMDPLHTPYAKYIFYKNILLHIYNIHAIAKVPFLPAYSWSICKYWFIVREELIILITCTHGDIEKAKDAIITQLAKELKGKPYAKHLIGNRDGHIDIYYIQASLKLCRKKLK